MPIQRYGRQMGINPDLPDPTLYIGRLTDGDAFHREAAAWSLGEMGSPRAARPLAGLLLRELQSVERSGYLHHTEVVSAVIEAIRRIGATEALYALLKAVCVVSRARLVDKETIVELVDSIGDVGGPNAVREAADRVVREADKCERPMPCLPLVGEVLLTRLGLCGDAAVTTLKRLANGGPADLQPIAERVCATL